MNNDPMTERQHTYLIDLMGKKQITDEQREKAMAGIEAGLSRATASKWIERLLTYADKPKKSWNIPENIPDGRYAVEGKDGNWKFFRIVTRERRTDGVTYRLVQKVLGAPGDFRYVRTTQQEWEMAVKVIAEEPSLASMLFGLQVGACGVCGSPLTNAESIALGIGPICARKMEWM